MTVPPYVAGAIGVWLFSWSSDRFQERTYHLLAGMTIVIIGLILTTVVPLDNIGGRYAGLMVLMFGAFIHSPSKYDFIQKVEMCADVLFHQLR